MKTMEKTRWTEVARFCGGDTSLPKSVAHPTVSRCLDFLAHNFNRPIQIQDLVKMSGMSRRGLLKAFGKHVGANPGATLRRVRIEYAQRLLTEQDLPLKAIAKHCGYRSVNSFYVSFSRFVGLPPKEYQKQVLLARPRQLQKTLMPAAELIND
jgi:AraC family transcriptional regulator, transcriptional activator FtrA